MEKENQPITLVAVFTACFAKEKNKGFFSLYNFHCSLKEKEAKIQVLKTREDGQDLKQQY